MRVLFATGDAVLMEIAVLALARLGHEVKTAANGVLALQSWLEFQPELVLLDADTEQMDGFDVCRVLRMSSGVPVVLLVAAGEEQALIRGYESGADDCIVKPFGVRQLEVRVEALLRRMEVRTILPLVERSGIVVVADIVVDTDQIQVYKNRQRVPMTPLEFRILQYLAGNAERVVAAEQLGLYAWKGQPGNDVGRLKVHVSRLRQKLLKAGGKPVEIRAVTGMGYALSGRKSSGEVWPAGRPSVSDPRWAFRQDEASEETVVSGMTRAVIGPLHTLGRGR